MKVHKTVNRTNIRKKVNSLLDGYITIDDFINACLNEIRNEVLPDINVEELIAQRYTKPYEFLSPPHQSEWEGIQIGWQDLYTTIVANFNNLIFQSEFNHNLYYNPTMVMEGHYDMRDTRQWFIHNMIYFDLLPDWIQLVDTPKVQINDEDTGVRTYPTSIQLTADDIDETHDTWEWKSEDIARSKFNELYEFIQHYRDERGDGNVLLYSMEITSPIHNMKNDDRFRAIMVRMRYVEK